jgi:mannan endo-1,4-beta-mannosidase
MKINPLLTSLFLIVAASAAFFGAFDSSSVKDNRYLASSGQTEASFQLVDKDATPETRQLAVRLKSLVQKGFMLGQQNATTEGVGWQNQGDGFCGDVCKVTKLHPAVYGWDFSDVFEKDETYKQALREKMIQVYEAGGINEISWHMINPVTRGNYEDKTFACARILSGGDLNGEFLNWMDQFAYFLKQLKTKDGTPIPVIFRPWHEPNATWFWWGIEVCSSDHYKELWSATLERLRDVDQVHQLLWAYSYNWVPGENLGQWPGDDKLDIIGIDFYFLPLISSFQPALFKRQLNSLAEKAREKGKIAAVTEMGYQKEMGYQDLPGKKFWSSTFLNTMDSEEIAHGISYVLFWRNTSKDHYFLPYPGDVSVEDFNHVVEDPSALFLENISTVDPPR